MMELNHKLNFMASYMNLYVPPNAKVKVDTTWWDFGADIKWETLIFSKHYTTPSGIERDSSYQMLYPSHMDTIKKTDDYGILIDLADEIMLKQEDLIF